MPMMCDFCNSISFFRTVSAGWERREGQKTSNRNITESKAGKYFWNKNAVSRTG